MEAHPREITQVARPLVFLVGWPAQAELQAHANLNFVCLESPAQLEIPAKDRRPPNSEPPAGILKSRWLAARWSSRPSVVLHLIRRSELSSPPASWARLVASADRVRSFCARTRARGCWAVVQDAGHDASPGGRVVKNENYKEGRNASSSPPLSSPHPLQSGEAGEERVQLLCRQAGLERRDVLSFQPQSEASAGTLANAVASLARQQLASEGARRVAAHAAANAASPELRARAAFKAGALAELAGDAGLAVVSFREAYAVLTQMTVGLPTPLQRFREIRAAAELAHLKLLLLLLRALHKAPEAARQHQTHLAVFGATPFGTSAPASLRAEHALWLARQLRALAQLLAPAQAAQLQLQFRPRRLLLKAAAAAQEGRRLWREVVRGEGGEGGMARPLVALVPGPYVGQMVDAATHARVSDDVFAAWLAAGEGAARSPGAEAADPPPAALLRMALAAEGEPSRATPELQEALARELGAEGRKESLPEAVALLQQAAEGYRLGAWAEPLAGALRALVDVLQAALSQGLEVPLGRGAWEGRPASERSPAKEERGLGGVEVRREGERGLAGEQDSPRGTSPGTSQGASKSMGDEVQLETSPVVPEPSAATPLSYAAALALASLELHALRAPESPQPSASSGASSPRTRALPGSSPPDFPAPCPPTPATLVEALERWPGTHEVSTSSSAWLTLAPLTLSLAPLCRSGTPGLVARAAWFNALSTPLAWTRVFAHIRTSGGYEELELEPASDDREPEPTSAQRSANASSSERNLIGLEDGQDAGRSKPALNSPAPSAPHALAPRRWTLFQSRRALRCAGAASWESLRVRWGPGGAAELCYRVDRLPPQPSPWGAGPGRSLPAPPPRAAQGPARASLAPAPASAPLLVARAPALGLAGERLRCAACLLAPPGTAVQGLALSVRAQNHRAQAAVPVFYEAKGAGGGGAEKSCKPFPETLWLGDVGPRTLVQVPFFLDLGQRGHVEVRVFARYTLSLEDQGGAALPGARRKCSEPDGRRCLEPMPPPHPALPPISPSTSTLVSFSLAVEDALALEPAVLGLPDTHVLLPAPGESPATPAQGLVLLRDRPSALRLTLRNATPVPLRLEAVRGRFAAGVEVKVGGKVDGEEEGEAERAQHGEPGKGAPASTSSPASQPLARASALARAPALHRGDAHAVLVSASASAEAASAGEVLVRWRRAGLEAADTQLVGVRAAKRQSPAEMEALWRLCDEEGEEGGSAQSPDRLLPLPPASCGESCFAVLATLPLPAVRLDSPGLTACAQVPPRGRLGAPLALRVVLGNPGTKSQLVTLAVSDPRGFMIAGPRVAAVRVLPRSSERVLLGLVPYHAGLLSLPAVQVRCQSWVVDVCQGRTLYVERPDALAQA